MATNKNTSSTKSQAGEQPKPKKKNAVQETYSTRDWAQHTPVKSESWFHDSKASRGK